MTLSRSKFDELFIKNHPKTIDSVCCPKMQRRFFRSCLYLNFDNFGFPDSHHPSFDILIATSYTPLKPNTLQRLHPLLRQTSTFPIHPSPIQIPLPLHPKPQSRHAPRHVTMSLILLKRLQTLVLIIPEIVRTPPRRPVEPNLIQQPPPLLRHPRTPHLLPSLPLSDDPLRQHGIFGITPGYPTVPHPSRKLHQFPVSLDPGIVVGPIRGPDESEFVEGAYAGGGHGGGFVAAAAAVVFGALVVDPVAEAGVGFEVGGDFAVAGFGFVFGEFG